MSTRSSASGAPPDALPDNAARGRALGEFVRAHRERLLPSHVGLAPGLRRRAKGLRREELASLCGISATWLTWIEQGRAPAVSVAVLARLGDALKLTRAERDYLYALAAQRDPGSREQPSADPALQALLADTVQAIAAPAYVLDRGWNAVAWNRRAAGLFVGWLDARAADRNLLRYTYLEPSARTLIDDWPNRAARLAAEFRADQGDALGQPWAEELIAALCRGSAEFDAAWRRHDVLQREGGERVFHHPRLGRVAYRQLTWRMANAPEFKLVMLV